MIISQKMSTELVDEKEVQKPTDRYDVYQEVEKIGLDDGKVTIKELVGSFTKEEIENDIENLNNYILDLQNQKRDKEQILASINN